MSAPSPLLSPFVLGQVAGLSATGFFAASTLGASPFNLISVVESPWAKAVLPQMKGQLLGPMMATRGRPAMLGSVLIGAAGYLTSYYVQPTGTSISHGRALLLGAAALIVSIPHTIALVGPIYKQLGEVANMTEERGKIQWAKAIRQYYRGNAVRLSFFGVAYACGVYGLALTSAV